MTLIFRPLDTHMCPDTLIRCVGSFLCLSLVDPIRQDKFFKEERQNNNLFRMSTTKTWCALIIRIEVQRNSQIHHATYEAPSLEAILQVTALQSVSWHYKRDVMIYFYRTPIYMRLQTLVWIQEDYSRKQERNTWPQTSKHQSRIYTLLIPWNNRGASPTTCTVSAGATGHSATRARIQ